MAKNPLNKKLSITGIVITIVVTVGFVWAAVLWFNRYTWPPKLTVKDMQANEVRVFTRLQVIIQAQKKYKQKDWDGDGKKSYAEFLVHLWKSIDVNGRPVPVALIPKKLAFATGDGRTSHGYYFKDLHDRTLPRRRQIIKLDYEKEWAVAAAPGAFAETGFLIFLADHSGQILAKKQMEVPSSYPHDPLSNGWTKIQDVEQLRDFQKMVHTEQ